MENLVNELHRQARKNFTRRKYVMRGLMETLQIDLIDMQKHAALNKGYKWILIAIDTFSKKTFLFALKNKTPAHVAEIFESKFLRKQQSSNEKIEKIQSDNGVEFYGKPFQSLMKKYNIHLYSSYSNLKASIVERCVLTIKRFLYKRMSLRGKYVWYDILQEVQNFYNGKFHRTIKMAPNDVNTGNAEHLLKTVYNYSALASKKMKPKFKVGDHVRISKYKHVFEKSYEFNFTPEVFTIKSVHNTRPITYTIEDYEGTKISGKFYTEELQLAKNPDIFLIEKILKTRGDKMLVKWLGYDQNSWINKNDIV